MLKRQTVLVVDDEREIAQVACIRFREAGYNTLTAADGEMGVAAAAREQPDAILLDVRMPRMDGLTALRKLRLGDSTRHIPIVMLSASLVDQPAALKAGARFFLTKPFDAPILVAAVKRAIEEVMEAQ